MLLRNISWVEVVKDFYETSLPWFQTTLAPFLFSIPCLPCLLMHSFVVPSWSVKATNEEPRKEGDYNQPSTWLSFQTLLGSGVGGTLRSTGIMWQNQFIKLAHRQWLSSIWSHQYCSVQLHKEKEWVGNKVATSLFLKDNEICAETGHAEKSSK